MESIIKIYKLILFFMVCSLNSTAFAQSSGAINSQPSSYDTPGTIVPECKNSSSDPDGDGWGWENMRSCHVGGSFTRAENTICKSSSSDPDGDGWGWENGASCVVSSASKEDRNQTNSNENSIQANTSIDFSSYDGTIDNSSAISNSGFAYVISYNFSIEGDSMENKSVSTLRLFEDGRELESSHSPHRDIREIGNGRFSHWGNKLYFSASDNSDPRYNEKVYTYLLRNNSNNQQEIDIEEEEDFFDEPDIAAANTVSSPRNSDVNSSDLRTRLLANPDKIGYGRNATGGSNYVYVSNFNELQNALRTSGNYIVLDSSLAGRGIGFTSPIFKIGNNVTLDGSLAPGSYFYPSYPSYPINSPMLNCFLGDNQGENIIIHKVTFRGQRSASYDSSHPSYNVGAINLRGRNIWLDRVEVTNFWDDAIGTGQAGDYITMSNLKVHNTDKGVMFYYTENGDRHVSLFNSDISAAQRTPRNKGASHAHMWNNYIHDVRYGAGTAGFTDTKTIRRNEIIRTISENNVFENTNPNAEHAEKANQSLSLPFRVEGFIYSDGNQYNGNNTRAVDFTNNPPWNVPYNYTLMPTSEVKAFVTRNAGP